jgi:protein-tyrosine phosphatase
MEGGKILLLEIPHTSVPAGALQLIRWLRANSIRPLIAHPERNQEIIRHPEKIRPLASQGALFQLTAGSLTGAFGSKSRRSAQELLQAGLGHVIASDAHNLGRRSPELLAGMQAAAGIVGESKAGDMVDATPRQLTAALFV